LKALNVSKLVADGDISRLEAEFARKGLTLKTFCTPFGNVLHAAAAFGTVATFIKLLERSGLSVNSQSQEGSTPLHVAARLGKFEMVEYLMSREEDIDDTIRDLEGKTCLDVAKSRQIINIIECTSGFAARINSVFRFQIHLHSQTDAKNAPSCKARKRACFQGDIRAKKQKSAQLVLNRRQRT